MTISYLYEGVKEQGDIQKVVSKGWCKESSGILNGDKIISVNGRFITR